MADDLSTPLGRDKKSKQSFKLPVAVPQVVAGLLVLSLAGFAIWAMVADDPLGGEPRIVAAAVTAPNAPSGPANPNRYDGPVPGAAAPAAAPSPGQAAPLPPGARTVTVIDGSTGKRQDVVVTDTDEDPAAKAPATPEGPSGGDPRLLENSRHGQIPRVGEDGVRPSSAYAKPVKPLSAKPDAPRIAIIVGGLGIGASTTNDAIAKLPAAVTLAFAPYGADAGRAAARAGEHEFLLQVPMEPFDYPDNDPGPQTLLTSLDPGQNIDRMQWLMSRLRGYVGIANFMGARFTASEQSLSPVLKEAAKRGLIYFDDGTSPRSVAGQIAGANSFPFAKADIVLDSVPTAADIDRALGRLEAMARQRGSAVGMATALPVSIDRIERWAKTAEGRGILLVPISAIATKTAKSS